MSNDNIEAIYGLAPMQQGMLFHTLYDPDSETSYFEWLDFSLKVNLNVEAFKHAWQHVLDRHSSLRAAFIWERQGDPLQVIRQKVPLPWTQLDWSGLSTQEQQDELKAYRRSEEEQGFELTKAPLMRLTLIQLDERSYHVIWCNHHLLFDGWSRVLIINEVFALYRSYTHGEHPQLPPALPYREYIGWLQRQDINAAEKFWRRTLAGFTEPTPLPPNSFRKELPDAQDVYGRARIYLSAETTAMLQGMAREHQLTLNTIMQGAWALLLSRYSGQRDVLFGAVVSGRPAELRGVEGMVGLFINTLPVRVKVEEEERGGEWLRGLQTEQAEARQYEYSPLVQVQGWSDVPRGVSLFESLLVFENYPIDSSLRDGDKDAETESGLSVEKSNYPLTVLAIPGRRLMLQFSFDQRRFDEPTMVRMLGHLRNLLEGIAADPDASLSSLSITGEEERRQLLDEWNQTATEYPRDLCVHELFDRQAALTPNSPAVTYDGQHLTYRQLQQRANGLAHCLRARGVGPESLVGVMCDRSPELVVSLLAILKAGGAYVPLDPTYPRERLRYMIEEARVRLVVTTAVHAAVLAGEAETLCLERDGEEIARQSEENPDNEVVAGHLAYVTFTSGSTGRPKGVGIPHRAVLRLIRQQNFIEFDSSQVFLQLAPVAFDASTFEIWGALLNGARLVVMSAGTPSPDELAQVVVSEGVTTLWLTSGLLPEMIDTQLESLLGLRELLAGGDVLSPMHVAKYVAAGGHLINGYGPTEGTTFTCCYRVDESWAA
ncbi:MAG: condensation domain-containing protein, partial [Pyrinomonadaceae bacterium]